MPELILALDEIEGKTVEMALMLCGDERPAIKFTDGSVIAFRAQTQWHDSPTVEICDLSEIDEGDQVKLGLLTQEEMDRRKRDRNEKHESAVKANRRRAYEQLKAEFGE